MSIISTGLSWLRTVLLEQDSLAIAREKVPGMSHVNVFGRNPDVDTGTVPEDMVDAGGVYLPPTQNRVHQLASTSTQDAGTLVSSGTISSGDETTLVDSSADFVSDGVVAGDIVLDDDSQDHSLVVSVDNATTLTIKPWHHIEEEPDRSYNGNDYRVVTPAGTGAAVAHIKQGKLENGTQLTKFYILNGTTNVATDEFFRIDRAHIHGVGSNGSNVGTITFTADVDGTVTAQINPDRGQTQMAFLHVPYGKTAFITKWYGSIHRAGAASSAMADLSLNSRLWGDLDDGKLLRSTMGISVDGGVSERNFDPPLRIRQQEDVWVRIEDVSDNNSIMSGGFDVILVDNE